MRRAWIGGRGSTWARPTALALLLASLASLASFVAPTAARAVPPPPEPELFPELAPPSQPQAGSLSEAGESDGMSDRAIVRWAIDELRRSRRRPQSASDATPEPPAAYHDGSPGPLFNDSGPSGGGPSSGDVLRLFGEAGGGLLGIAIGAGAGAMIAWALLEATDEPELELVAYGSAAILGGFGVALGVSLAGEALGGLGELGHAFVGQALGALVALPLAVYGVEEQLWGVAITALTILPLAGGMLGYEIAHLNRALGVRGSAFLAPTQGGALAGLRGTFS